MTKRQSKPDLAVVVPISSERLLDVPTVVDQVFDEWKRVTGREGKGYKKTKERVKAIKERLAEEYELDDLLDAVRGVMRSEWNVDRGVTELATDILGNGGKVEKFRDLWRNPPRARSAPRSNEATADAIARGVDRVFGQRGSA